MFDWLKKLFPTAPPVDPNAPPPEPKPRPLDRPLVRHAIQLAVTVGIALLTAYLSSQGIHIPPTVVNAVEYDDVEKAVKQVVEKKAAEPTPPSFGWYSDADTVSAARGQVPLAFRSTPAGGVEDLPANVFQWKVHEQVTGETTPEKDQGSAGSCVGQGGATAAERSLACAIASGEPYEFTEFAEEAAYAVSRVDVGRGQLRGQDGSVGGWMARTQTEYGNLPAKKYPDGDFTDYDARRAQVLGDRGVTAAIKAEMAKHKAGSAALLRTTLDLRKALANGHGAFVCTQRGYAAQRDANGVCRQQGVWGHCMCCDGYATVNGRVQYHLDNSWDHVYHRGPVGPGDPTGTGFYVTESEMTAILAEGDSWAISTVAGFPKQTKLLDWFAHARPQRRAPADPLGAFALTP